MSIGVVLERLREEFPDVTVSKIRFLESEGLITPQRTASGYRRFTDADVDRLRYILVTQRDNYLPLKVIREQLEAMDSGRVAALVPPANADPVVSPEVFRAPAPHAFTGSELAAKAKVDVEFVDMLVSAGLLAPDPTGHFNPDDVRIAASASALAEFGLDQRHLKTLRTTAVRQADLISRVSEPVAKSRRDGAQQKAEDLEQQLTALVVSLHASLVKSELRRTVK